MLGVAESAIKPGTTLDELGADSLDKVEMVMEFEEEFETEISDEDAEKLGSVQQIVDYIASRQPATAKGT